MKKRIPWDFATPNRRGVQFSLVENKDYPVYYDPFAPPGDNTVHEKWRPGLETAYPEENPYCLLKKNALICLLVLWQVIALSANPLLGGGKQDPVPTVRPPSSPGFLVEQQIQFRDKIADLIDASREEEGRLAVVSVLALAFLYGMLHAAGPGHRKTVIFSLILSGKVSWYEPRRRRGPGCRRSWRIGPVPRFSFSFTLRSPGFGSSEYGQCLPRGRQLYPAGPPCGLLSDPLSGVCLQGGTPCPSLGKGAAQGFVSDPPFHRGYSPCPGVIMILSFCTAMGVVKLGVLAVIALSLGMGVTISVAGYLAYFGREGLFSLLKKREEVMDRITHILEAGSYLFLLAFQPLDGSSFHYRSFCDSFVCLPPCSRSFIKSRDSQSRKKGKPMLFLQERKYGV